MAKILYGVMGNTYGHIMRTMSIIGRMPEHEYYFVGGGRVPEVLGKYYPVHEVPVLRTVHKQQRVDLIATIKQVVTRTLETPKIQKGIQQVIEEWKPDVAICDREFFLPSVCKKAGLPCISVDHSHVLKACDYPVPPSEFVSWALAMINDYLFFNMTKKNLIISFFQPPLKKNTKDEIFPPVIRPAVKEVQPSKGNHILLYQTSNTFKYLIDMLPQFNRPVIVYGFKQVHETIGNVTFKPFDEKMILEDLASAAYAIVNGGHNLISEALYYGKPVLCFPIAMLFEQFINAYHVKSLGYGDYCTSMRPDLSVFEEFEKNLSVYQKNLEGKNFEGTDQIVNRLQELIAQPQEAVL
jgi:uncharacterized protein (TIGR00661 family)